MMRPFLPPSLEALSGADGMVAARIAAEAQLRDAAFADGHARGLAEGLTRGRLEGVATGRLEGQAEAEAGFAEQRRHGAMAAEQALVDLATARSEDRAALDREVRTALAAVLTLVVPALLEREAGANLLALLAEAMTQRTADRIVVRAHPDTLALLEPGGFPAAGPLPGLAAGEAERLLLEPDPAMPPGAATAAWTGGGLLIDPRTMAARALAILGPIPTEIRPQQEMTP
jgi:flagellar assembly protein FliH